MLISQENPNTAVHHEKKSVSPSVLCVLVFQAILQRSQLHPPQGAGQQRTCDNPCSTVGSMLRLHQTLALFFWYFLLLHRWALADEEASWGPTKTSQTSSEKKSSNYWWTPSLPRFPSLSSFPFRNPFYGSSEDKNKASASSTASKGLTEPTDHFQDNTGSGEGIDSGETQSPTALTQGLLKSLTELRTESLPTGTPDSSQSSIVKSNNAAFVSPTISFIRNTLFTNRPTPRQNTTDTHPPAETTTRTKLNMDVTTQHHLMDEQIVYQEADSSAKVYSTIPPETTVPTALTWASVQTTTLNPGVVELTSTHDLRPVTNPAFVRDPTNSTVNVENQSSVGSTSETAPSQSHMDGGFSGTTTVNPEIQPGTHSSTLRIDREQHQKFVTSTNQSQGPNSTTAGGKQKYSTQ